MQIKAIFEDGIISIAQPLRFKHSKFEVIVHIPEAEVDDSTPLISLSTSSGDVRVGGNSSQAEFLLTKIKQILGPYCHQRLTGGVEQDKATYLEAMEEKYSK